jgi:hypothetical protein
VAGIGNVLRHDYEHLAHDVTWCATTCHSWRMSAREELAAAEIAGEQRKS